MDPNLTPPPQPNYNQPPQEKNMMAILGLIFAFIIPLLGLIFSIIGINKAKVLNSGRGLALAGILVSSFFMLITPIVIVLVLIAAPALQRNFRDAERSNDVVILRVQLENTRNENNGQLPTEGSNGTFADTVLPAWESSIYNSNHSQLVTANIDDDPFSTHILYVENGQPSSETYYPTVDSIHIWGGSKCASDFSEKLSTGDEIYAADEIESAVSRSYALVYHLESGEIICQDF